LRAKVGELEQKNFENRAKLEKYNLAMPELIKENELWRQKLVDFDKENKQKSQEIFDLKEKLEFDKKNSNFDQNYLEKKKENAEFLALQQALFEKDKEILTLKAKLQNLNLFCEQISKENNMKNQDLAALDHKNKELINEIRNLQKNPLGTEERKREFSEKIKDLEGKITLMITENQRLTQIIKEKIGENEYVAKILKEKLDENDHLKNLLNQLESKKNIEVFHGFFVKLYKIL